MDKISIAQTHHARLQCQQMLLDKDAVRLLSRHISENKRICDIEIGLCKTS